MPMASAFRRLIWLLLFIVPLGLTACSSDTTSSGPSTEDIDNPDNPDDPDDPAPGCVDPDADGYGEGADCLGTDCNQNDDTIYAGAPEICDGLDNDCNDEADDGLSFVDYYPDTDKDGQGDASAVALSACLAPDGDFVTNNTDCNDSDFEIYVGAPELCDGLDNDCDAATDEEVVYQDYYPDSDGDMHGDKTASPTHDCKSPGTGFVPVSHDDCNDSDEDIHPGADEVCDGVDNNCDAQTDKDGDGVVLSQSCYSGPSGTEGKGLCSAGTQLCEGASGYGACSEEVLPSSEICDGLDNDCNVLADDALSAPDAPDATGACLANVMECNGADGWEEATDNTPPATESCDGVDNNCDGSTDEGLTPPPRPIRQAHAQPISWNATGPVVGKKPAPILYLQPRAVMVSITTAMAKPMKTRRATP